MASNNPIDDGRSTIHAPAATGSEILRSLAATASSVVNAQLDAFIVRLSDALFKLSQAGGDAKEAGISFNASHLLKKNSYAFQYLASTGLEKILLQEIRIAEQPSMRERAKSEDTLSLSLVSYDEMDQKLLLGQISKPIETQNTDQLATLGIRLAHLLGRPEVSIAQNPFRPEVFLSAINDAWAEFDPSVESHHLVLPLLQPDVFLDVASILLALNDALIAHGILPQLPDAYRIKKSNATQEATKREEANDSAVTQQLKRLFAAPETIARDANGVTGDALAASIQGQVLQATAVSNQLLGYLAGVQKSGVASSLAGTSFDGLSGPILANLKKQAPQGTLTRVDETTIDLLTRIFDVVFCDRNIPSEIKALIGVLQVPVLKAALIDKDFFFKEEHPARRLIEVLTKSSVSWDQKQGQDDPLYKTIQHNVKRVQQEYDQEITVFSDVVSNIETFIKDEETVAAEALSAPITQALRQEKIVLATKAAKTEVSARIGTGEVVAFVETFLENKWVSVLTLAYSVKDEKPQAVESAIKTMDDLIWSVKPKITLEERKELIAKLPSMLGMLNKWLNLVKLDDAERLQFFAELAECHASIVRAPLEISPQRQLEIAMETAKAAAERRKQREANARPEPAPDTFAEKIQKLERGTWLEFRQPDGSARKVKLAWVSPLRNLYIFTTRDKLESFSMSADDLANTLRENRAEVVLLAGLVDRALAEAVGSVGANDPVIAPKSAA